MKTELTLWLPGAISPYLALPSTKLETLARLLSRAKKHNIKAGFEQALKGYFKGIPGEIPLAALKALSYGHIEPNNRQIWCLLTPIECLLTPFQVLPLGSAHLALTSQEMAQLSDLLTQHFQADNLQVITLPDKQWCCLVPKHTNIVMNDLHDALHKNMLSYLPSGEDQAFWRRLLTESQMLLQSCTVNQNRSKLILPCISSLWFSGLGPLPEKLTTDFDKIYTNESLVKGLAICAKRKVESFEALSPDLLSACKQQKVLIADFSLYTLLKHQDEATWQQKLAHLENNWFKRLFNAMLSKQIDSLTLNFNDGYHYQITRRHLKYFWRKIHPITCFANP